MDYKQFTTVKNFLTVFGRAPSHSSDNSCNGTYSIEAFLSPLVPAVSHLWSPVSTFHPLLSPAYPSAHNCYCVFCYRCWMGDMYSQKDLSKDTEEDLSLGMCSEILKFYLNLYLWFIKWIYFFTSKYLVHNISRYLRDWMIYLISRRI